MKNTLTVGETLRSVLHKLTFNLYMCFVRVNCALCALCVDKKVSYNAKLTVTVIYNNNVSPAYHNSPGHEKGPYLCFFHLLHFLKNV